MKKRDVENIHLPTGAGRPPLPASIKPSIQTPTDDEWFGVKLIDVIQAVVPSETHFVVSDTEYIGILSYWMIAKIKDSKGDLWIYSFPICEQSKRTLYEHVQVADDLYVRHWAEFRSEMHRYFFYGDEKIIVSDLLDKLWGINHP